MVHDTIDESLQGFLLRESQPQSPCSCDLRAIVLYFAFVISRMSGPNEGPENQTDQKKSSCFCQGSRTAGYRQAFQINERQQVAPI